MINFKQEELIEELMEQIGSQFPEVRLIKVMEGCDDPETLWIKVTSPEDEDRELELIEFAGDKVTDILLDYGYHMLVMPVSAQQEAACQRPVPLRNALTSKSPRLILNSHKKEDAAGMKKAFLEKAAENLNAAEICFEKAMYNACANRAYYAALQAAVSALADQGIKRDRIDHKWVQAEFSGKLIKRRKIYSGRLKSYLVDMQAVRDKADYELIKINKKAARKQLVNAEELVTAVKKEIEK